MFVRINCPRNAVTRKTAVRKPDDARENPGLVVAMCGGWMFTEERREVLLNIYAELDKILGRQWLQSVSGSGFPAESADG